MSVSMQEAAQKRAAAAEKAVRSSSDKLGRAGQSFRSAPPDNVSALRRSAPQPAQMRAERVQVGGKDFLQITGYATVYERGYEMWDWAGPYTEIVTAGAGAKTLSTGPNVVYQVNHGGWPFARTTSGTLDLLEDTTGLLNTARLNPGRSDAQNLYQAVEDGSINEMSFMFGITAGQWSPDYTEYRINEFDLERGDVSPVTFGANPHTSIEARAAQFELRAEVMRALRQIDEGALNAARGVLAERLDDQGQRGAGLSVAAAAAQDVQHLRACILQNSVGDEERAVLAALLERAATGDLDVLAGEGPLSVLLGVTTPASRAEASKPEFVPERVDFLATELDAARELTF